MAAQLHYIIYLAKLLLSFWRLTKNSGNGSVNNKENNNNEVLSNIHICTVEVLRNGPDIYFSSNQI